MKRIVYLIMIVCFAFGMNVLNAQNGKEEITIPPFYQHTTTSPQMFKKGDVLILEADSIFLVNNRRMRFYKSLHQDALQPLPSYLDTLMIFLNVIEHYKKEIDWYDGQLKGQQDYAQELLKRGQNHFEILNVEIEKARNDIKDLKVMVNQTDLINQQPSFWKKIERGIPYFIVGGLTGALIWSMR